MTGYLLSLLTQTLLFAAMASSYNLLIGFGRLFSIAQGAFIGLGAYAVGAGAVNFGWPTLPALALGVVAGGVVGLFLGAVALRVSDDYLAIATFAFQILFTTALTNLKDVTSGAYGIPGVPPLGVAGLAVASRPAQLGLALAVLLLTLEATRRLRGSPFGLILRAAGEDEVATRALGKRTRQAKVVIFAVSGALAALAGGVYASFVGFIIPEMFNIHFSMLLLSMVIIGGAGSISGPVAGAALMVLLPELLNFVGVTDNRVSYVRQALFGAALLLVVVVFQRGMVRPRRFGGAGVLPAESAPPAAAVAGPAPVDCQGVQKRFGGVVAVESVTTTLAAGRVTGVVGPNGAGKTTLFDLVTGFERPDAGVVRLGGTPLDGEGPDERCRLGLVRSFQNLRLFPRLTVLENVMVAVPLGWAEGAGRPSSAGGGPGRPRPRPRRPPSGCWPRWASRPGWTGSRPSSPTPSRSSSAWPGSWPPGPGPSCSTSRLRGWIPGPWPGWPAWCGSRPGRAERCAWWSTTPRSWPRWQTT